MPGCGAFLLAGLIASGGTAAVFTLKQLEGPCGYAKPFLITYLQEAGSCLACGTLACLVHPSGASGALAQCRQVAGRAGVLGLLAFTANCCYAAALRFTAASSAMTLEQLTSVFVAVLSCCVLGERYGPGQLLGLAAAVAGAVATAQVDARSEELAIAPKPMLGDALVVATSTCAAVYMVYFKRVFDSLGWTGLLVFFATKSAAIITIGWTVLTLGLEVEALPNTACQQELLAISVLLSVLWNLAVNWGILTMSPLAVRLFVLLGLPLALLVDVVQGRQVRPSKAAAVALVVAGVALFEASPRLSKAKALGEPLLN